jgi:uncharacterized membrane protein HdeD (DUF308 family)
MNVSYWVIPAIIGAFFVVFGIGLIIWGVKEGTDYYDSLVNGFDLREFFSKWPPRAEPQALITGGWISIMVGIVTGVIGLLLYLNR